MNSGTNEHCGARRRIRTLIVDDSAAFRRAVGQLLDRLTYIEVIGMAEDGEQALALVSRTEPDLVLMDLQMPRLDGLRTTRQMRDRFPAVRVVLISVHDSEQWKVASEAAGADRFISKAKLREELPGAVAHLFPGGVWAVEEA